MAQEIIDLVIRNLTFISTLFGEEIVNILNYSVGTAIAQTLPLFMAGFSVYMLLVSLNWLRGGIDDNFLGTIKSAIGWLLIIGFGFNFANYIKISEILYTMPDQLGFVILGREMVDKEMFSPFTEFMRNFQMNVDIVAKDLGKFDFTNKMLLALSTFVTLFFTGSLLVVTYAFYLVAKISLLLTLFVGPVFIGFMLFPVTRQYGMNWIGQILNYTFTIVFYMVISSLLFKVQAYALDELKIAGMVTLPGLLNASFAVAFTSILLIFVLFFVPSMASALTGGSGISFNSGVRAISKLASFVPGLQKLSLAGRMLPTSRSR
ncbi:type IV secretion system protein [Oligella urethralis]|uniref:type IV secretion system protein n=1 Tax=Oligella urethralis TaxID=90245 RepID=UPI002431501E|nr:type IV secretion system protein [Oligella urethralis]